MFSRTAVASVVSIGAYKNILYPWEQRHSFLLLKLPDHVLSPSSPSSLALSSPSSRALSSPSSPSSRALSSPSSRALSCHSKPSKYQSLVLARMFTTVFISMVEPRLLWSHPFPPSSPSSSPSGVYVKCALPPRFFFIQYCNLPLYIWAKNKSFYETIISVMSDWLALFSHKGLEVDNRNDSYCIC